jgi:hypothetical protein
MRADTHFKPRTPVSGIANFFRNLEFNRFGLVSVILMVVGGLGGIAIGVGAHAYVATLILVIVPTMATLSLLLAIAPMRWILFAGAIGVLIDIVLIIYFLLV